MKPLAGSEAGKFKWKNNTVVDPGLNDRNQLAVKCHENPWSDLKRSHIPFGTHFHQLDLVHRLWSIAKLCPWLAFCRDCFVNWLIFLRNPLANLIDCGTLSKIIIYTQFTSNQYPDCQPKLAPPTTKIFWSGSWVWRTSVGEKLRPNRSCSDQSNCQGGLYTMMDSWSTVT